MEGFAEFELLGWDVVDEETNSILINIVIISCWCQNVQEKPVVYRENRTCKTNDRGKSR